MHSGQEKESVRDEEREWDREKEMYVCGKWLYAAPETD